MKPLLMAIAVSLVNSSPVIISSIEQNRTKYETIAKTIWEYAETAYEEYKSSELLLKEAKNAGFTARKGVAEIPTAFIAEFGSGKPVIAILAEFDALPGLSQDTVASKKALIEGGSGHGCGHNLFGAASLAAAISVKEWLIKEKRKGTVRLYGTPAEEGGSGKVYMVRAGLFNDVDAVLHWHASTENSANPTTSMANVSAKFRFKGVSSHAAIAPERGRSALDGVEAMNMMVNMMREHVSGNTRIHYVITNGGNAPNVVPDFAEVYYYARNFDIVELQDVFKRIIEVSKGAAMGTGTQVDHEVMHGSYPLLPNETLAKLMYDNMTKIGGVKYSGEDSLFAANIQKSANMNSPDFTKAATVTPFQTGGRGFASTDVGDVSWTAPTAGVNVASYVPGIVGHSWQAVACSGNRIGYSGMINAAKIIALTASDLFKQPALLEKAKNEFSKSRGNAEYSPILGDRKPPLKK